MNLLLSMYVGGVIVGLLDARKLEKVSLNDLLSLLSRPLYAILVIVQMVCIHSGTIISKTKTVYDGLTILWDWVLTRFRKK